MIKKELYTYHDLSDEAKKYAVSEVWEKEVDKIDWDRVRADLKEDVGELANQLGFQINEIHWEYHGRAFLTDTCVQIKDYEKLLGKRLYKLYEYLEDITDDYMTEEINFHRGKIYQYEFDFSSNLGTEYMLDVIDNNLHLKPKSYHIYDFYRQIASETELFDKYGWLIEKDFKQIGDILAKKIEDRLAPIVESFQERIEDTITNTLDYSESEECIQDQLEDGNFYLAEKYMFLLDGTPVEEDQIPCSICDGEYEFDEIVQTEKDGKLQVICLECEEEMKEAI